MPPKKTPKPQKLWTCPKCGRIFQRAGQQHSCKKVPISQHFKNKDLAKELYDKLLKRIEEKIGKYKVVSLPCCVHLFGNYDFIALLPKKDKLEIRFMLDRELKNPRIFATPPLSKKTYKNCLYISDEKDIDEELIAWLKESYSFKS